MSDHAPKAEDLAREIATWHDRIESAITGTRFTDARVIAECASTQDVARELGTGYVVTTGLQHAGRGRPGHHWHDPGAGGVAVSMVVASAQPAQLSTASVLAVLDAIDQLATVAPGVGAKFPNDVIDHDGRKLAGVLIEGDGTRSVIGIGVNVRPTTPPAFHDAVSLEQRGTTVERIELIEALIKALDGRLQDAQDTLARDFAERHLLLGGHVRISCGGTPCEGILVSADPFGLLKVESPDGIHSIPAAQATLQEWSLPAD